MLRLFKIRERVRWWEIEDEGGFSPWMPAPLINGERLPGSRAPWPTEWRQRPHP